MSDATTITAISDLAVEAAGRDARMYAPIGGTEPAGVYFVNDASGEVSRRESAVVRRLVAGDLAAVIKAVEEFAWEDTPELWVHVSPYEAAVVGRFPETPAMAHSVTLPLPLSAPYMKLVEVAKSPVGLTFKQHELYNLLKTTLCGCFPRLPDLVNTIGRVDFHKRAEATGQVSRNNTSISKTLVALAAGMDNLPEYPTFDVPLFRSGWSVTAAVRCYLEADPQSESFRLVVLPGEVEHAAEYAADAILAAATRGLAERRAELAAAYTDPSGDSRLSYTTPLVFLGKPG